jgi:hypothetical protein
MNKVLERNNEDYETRNSDKKDIENSKSSIAIKTIIEGGEGGA